MRLVVLTTDTLHHAHFVRELGRSFPISRVIEETTCVTAPFPTAHSFEEEREAYESDVWFGGASVSIADFGDVSRYPDVNDEEVIRELHEFDQEIVVVFGSRKLQPRIIDACQGRIINLHGGDPELYRGLDSHLWAIYHGDFDALVTTIHLVNEELDDGHIVACLPLPITSRMRLHELRKVNTEVCIELTRSALQAYREHNQLAQRKQSRRGRYYSFMPTVLKELCVHKFERHTESLCQNTQPD